MAKTFMQIYRWAAVLAWGVLACSCSDDGEFSGNGENEQSSEVQFLVKTVGNGSVNVSSRAGEDEIDMADPRNNFPRGYDFIQDRSRIRVCSVSRDPNTNFGVPDMDNPYEETKKNYAGYHEYICKQYIPYEDYSIFNTYENAEPLIWDNVKEDGTVEPNTGNILRTSVGGGYYMYAAMFPYVYQPLEGSTINNRAVAEDQTYKPVEVEGYYAANLLVNDFRLCYKMFGRDKFREPIRLDFYHTLCMLVVNVEIPRYDVTDGTGFTDEAIANADEMTLNDVYRCFKPNYTKAYDQNDFVEVSATQVEGATARKVQMFHTPNFSAPKKEKDFEVTDRFWEQDKDHDDKDSKVAWTQFCAILPPQQFSDVNSYISFEIGGRRYRCNLAGNPAIPLRQTYVTTITLYIPRGESDPVIIGAHLNDWEKHHTPIIPLQ